QLGYMFLAVGVGAFAAGIFHLMTHAFFKACLFLCAGSVMHALLGELDIRKMGGLKKYMPATFWTFFIATLAISGIPGLSGFFSKDEILWGAFSSPRGHFALWLIGFITAGMTAFYMFRALFVAFLGKERLTDELKEHVHESPKIMTIPLWILAILAIVGGYVGLPSEKLNIFHRFMEPSFEQAHHVISAHAAEHHVSHSVEWLLMGLSILVALAGIYLAYLFYIKKPELPKKFVEKFPTVYDVVHNKYYWDEWNNYLVVQPLKRASTNFLWGFVDNRIIDGAVNGCAWLARNLGGLLRRVQSGYVFNYALAIVIGLVFIVGYLVLF
ncbi:MAG TPA: NADH-quinone oxidoreductase subunit L, partial [Proteobacteria bacterium]|nr:NADH-quinone oxidoreductase subunit L [Pseudomonadota bacterium]